MCTGARKIYYYILVVVVVCFIFGCSSHGDDIASSVQASFTIQQDEHNLLVNEPINFTSTSSVTSSNQVVYSWDFGDGGSSSEPNPSHTYAQLGNYVVKLTLTKGSETSSFSKALVLCLNGIIPNRASLSDTLLSSSKENKILLCAHRGLHESFPENSLVSISEAIKNNISMVELDIRPTKDGELVLMHDATIDRTTNGTGNVGSMTYQELSQFYLKKSNGTLTLEKIPTLKEVLALARGKIYLNLDIDDQKSPPLKVLQVVKQYGMEKQVMFFSSSYSDVSTLYQQNPSIIAMPTVYSQNAFNTYSNSSLNIKTVHYNATSFTTSLINQAKTKGWYIFLNAYILTTKGPDSDNYGQIDDIIRLKGNIIQTDYPILIKNYLTTKNIY